MYRLPIDKVLTPSMVQKYIEKDAAEKAHKQKLYNYYIGKHDICNRITADAAKPNNKIVNPFANYITDIMTGYFVGEPITYTSQDEELMGEVSAIFNYNDEAVENSSLAKDASIYGSAYEQIYIDADGNVRFQKLDAISAIPIYDDTIEADLLYFIRYYADEDILTGDTTEYVEVFSRTYHQLYKKNVSALTLISEEQHSFGMVPIVVYKNNEEEIGDFEPVISLIDAYDKIQSDSVNDMEYFADAYLALYGMSGTDANDIAAMKEQRVLLMASDAKAEWLVKQINDTYVENLKHRLEEDIHKFSACPSMTDQDFASNASGVAMKYKLMGLDNKTSKKEHEFKKGLQRRLEIICNILAITGSAYDYMAIEVHFKRNTPSNITEISDMLNKVGHLLSHETQIDLLPIGIDASAEMERIAAEENAGYNNYDIQQVNENEVLGEESTK